MIKIELNFSSYAAAAAALAAVAALPEHEAPAAAEMTGKYANTTPTAAGKGEDTAKKPKAADKPAATDKPAGAQTASSPKADESQPAAGGLEYKTLREAVFKLAAKGPAGNEALKGIFAKLGVASAKVFDTERPDGRQACYDAVADALAELDNDVA